MTPATIILAVFLILAVFVAAKLDDKLLKERHVTKGLLEQLGQAKAQTKDLERRIQEANTTIQKLNHKLEARGIDYDRLLTDYHRLENENLK